MAWKTERKSKSSQSYKLLSQESAALENGQENPVPVGTRSNATAESHDHNGESSTNEKVVFPGEGREDESPRSSIEANEPLLSDSESDGTLVEEEKVQGDSKEETKKSFNKAEYQIAFSHFLRIFSYSTWSDRLLLLAASVTSICTGITLPLMNVVFGQLVGAFSGLYDPSAGQTKEMFLEVINRNVIYMIYLFIARLCLDYVAILGFRISSIRISAAIRLAYLQALFKQPISVLDTLPQGQTAAIITVTGNTLQLGISEKLSMFLQSTSLVITALIVAFHYSWLLTLVTSIGLLFIIVFYACTIPRLVRMLKEVEHADRMSSSIASEVFSSVRMVAACGAEGKMSEAYAAWVDESKRRGILMSPLVAIQQAPVFFAIHATFALSFWFAIKLYTEFQISSVATIIIVLMSIMSIVMSIGSISAPVTAAAHAAGAASIFFSIIDAPQPKCGTAKHPEVSSQEDIVLENVNFAYPLRHDVKVLDNLNVRFPAGKLTAIVGASGSGKSTIVGLIERWYEMDGNMTDNMLTLFFRNGTIKIGDQNLHEIDLKWWRSQIGLVQQEPFLFNDTIFKNVEYGLIGTEWECDTEEMKMRLVRRACKEAFADEFITRLPDGYETVVGDAGIKLSGGQRQRIAIARSIVKRPKILILDEATSAIDVKGEQIVQAALDKVSQGRTTITIAHRLSTIVKADNIVVLNKGQVVQQGSHDQLMADEDGPYWALANAQMLSLGAESQVSSSSFIAEKEIVEEEVLENISIDTEDFKNLGDQSSTAKVYFGSFGLFLWEQKSLWRWYILMVMGALGAGVAFPTHSFLFAKLISLFNLWGKNLIDQTNHWCLVFFCLALGVFVSYYAVGYGSNTISFNVTAKYRQEYFQNTLSKPISYYDSESNSVGALTSRIASDPVQLQQLLGINMAIVLVSIFNITGSITLSFFFGWKLTLITVMTAVPIILAAGFFRIRYETQFERMNNEVFEESSKFATESIGAFRTVSSLVLEDAILGRYERLLRDHSKSALQKARFSTLVFALSDSISLLCMAFVLWYGGQLVADYEYTSFNYLVVYLAVVQGSTSAGQSLSFGPNIAQAFAAASRIRSMRPQRSIEGVAPSLDLEGSESDEKGGRGVKIELKNVWFKYPTRDIPVLQGLSMTIERGQFAAIVGPSGCGKTSIISLLERFYSPQKGQVLLHSTDISTIDLDSYRSHLSLVSQEASLFEGTIRTNILLGLPSSTPNTTSLLERACKEAEIHDFISSLPEGYSTKIGPKGIALSGGQKQRLALARALIRNPRVLLLDEATSNLDSETERAVQATLERTAKGRTMVVVAHRLATVQNADIIFVVSEGKVVEKGNHQTLLEKRGVYWQMCQSQALDR